MHSASSLSKGEAERFFLSPLEGQADMGLAVRDGLLESGPPIHTYSWQLTFGFHEAFVKLIAGFHVE